ncbi:hypothetical protein [Pseudomonas yangonensis]|uniref:hypothetical protein n=1 Tax=Pseudomonas yangonensis TaxID=2579922 RepID=UPI0013797571|nr:hypothetical protein [Pseudomonas yangonensis]
MVSGITLREFDELALRYAQVFHYSFTWKGLRSWQLRVALYCFAGMLISFVPYAWATGTGWLNQLLYLIPVLVFEVAGMLLWLGLYDPLAREQRIRYARLLGDGISYQRKNIDLYKTNWLGRELRVPANKYLDLVKSLSEVRELNSKSRQAALYLGDRIFSGFFSVRPLLKISLIPPLLGLLMAVLRSSLFEAQGLMEGIESNAGNYLGIAVFAVMMSVLVIVMLGFSFMAGGAIYTVVLDCYMKRCSVQSRERLVQELLKRACLV